ncbi:transposase, partial [Lapidilactobacillus salsurivasis]
ASIFAKRKFEVEPVFGNIKTNMNFMRFSVRGKRATNNEMGLVFMAANLKKLTKSLLNNDNLLVKFERFMALYLCTPKIDLAEKRKKIEHPGKTECSIVFIFRSAIMAVPRAPRAF